MPAAGGLLDAIAAAGGGLVDAFTINSSAGLALSDRLNLADGPSASNLLSTATPVESHDGLSIADEFDAAFGVPTIDQIGLSDHFAAAHIGKYGVVDALSLTDSLVYWSAVAGIEWQYHPFVGGGAAAAPAPALSPLPASAVRFELVSLTDPTDNVVLRAPDFVNKDRLGFNRVLRETRGGTLIVFADPEWPKTQTLALNFSGLTQAQAQALLTFLGNHPGQTVGMTDWEGRSWTGIVMNPDSPIIADSIGRYSASFQFEGMPT